MRSSALKMGCVKNEKDCCFQCSGAFVSQVDMFIGMGTSDQMYPAAHFLHFFSGAKEKYFIDRNPADRIVKSLLLLKGTVSEKMPELVETLSSKYH